MQEFPTTTLPPFTLITGVNGAGKTHLLRAILAGSLTVDEAPDHKADIKFYDWTSLHPNDAAQVTTSALYQERDQVLEWTQAARRQHDIAINDLLGRYSLLRKWGRDPWDVARASPAELEALISEPKTREEFERDLRVLLKTTTNAVTKHVSAEKNPELWSRVAAIAAGIDSLGAGVPALIREQDFRTRHISFGQADLFQHSFAQLFLAYFELQKMNRLNRLEVADGRSPNDVPLTEDEFRQRHGRPPWEFVNQTLQNARLNFKIDHPIEWTTSRYVPTLTKVPSGATMAFSALSSGEKILMSFALCLYYSTDKRQISKRPKLLLLDEIDAPLHPSMSRVLLEVIIKTLVEDEKMSVIMTTHSPSTAAVAPEGSLYTMTPDVPGLHAATRGQAVALLTADIPTLSITFHGRRQVFVESALDAERYEKLCANLHPSIQHERSLVFISAGTREKGGDRGAGCAQVTRIVGSLVSAGNASVFGLLDWDTSNNPTGRIHVLAHGERYSIENCLLDPLLVAALAVREKRDIGVELGLGPDEQYAQLPTLSTGALQSVVNKVQAKILVQSEQQVIAEHVQVNYAGGFHLGVAGSYLRMQGHTLEDAVKAAFPHLKKFHKTGELLMKLVEPVVFEMPGFVPSVLISAIRNLLDAEAT